MPAIYLRPATADDQPIITRMIREARLNPFGLHWPRFVVAEDIAAQRVAGIGQIKVLGDGTRELASLAVLPEYQGTGLGGAIVWTLLARTPGPVYLRCAVHNETYYPRFGFRTLLRDEMPRTLRREARLVNAVMGVINAVTGGDERMVIMGRDGEQESR